MGYTPNMAGAVWVGDPAHKRRMVNITIGGVGYDKVFGGKVPGPIWRDMMSGALEGKPSLDFNHVFIPDERPDRDRDRDRGDNDNGNGNGNNDDNGNGDDGDNDDGFFGGTDGGTTFPTPEFSIPENWIQGQTNGGNNGNGNGGGFG